MNKPSLVKIGLVLVLSGGVVPLFAQSSPKPKVDNPDSRPTKIVCNDGKLFLEGTGYSKSKFTMVEFLVKGSVQGTAKITETQVPPQNKIDYSKLEFSGPACPTKATQFTIRATNENGGSEDDTLTYKP